MANPKIGLSMLYTLGQPFDRMVEEIPRTKTKWIEVLDEGLHALNGQRVSELKNVAQSYDVEFSVHAPFAGVNIALQSKSLLNATLKRLKESILYAAGLSCRTWVFHPGMRTGISMFYPGEDWVRNLESVRFLSKFAEENGVRVALENVMEPFVLKSVAEFSRFYDEVGVEVGFALDIGHANLVGEVDSFLERFPDRLVHLHAHDNFGKRDQHLGVGYGNIDWGSVAGFLKKASFDGVVVVESVEHVQESVQRLRGLLLQ